MSDVSMHTALTAKNAYASTKTDTGKNIIPENVISRDESAFAQLLGQLQDTQEATRMAETKSLQAIGGKADVVDVVNAITNAEIAIETLVATRDKVIGAYKEILNMPI